jgi:CRISPR/Cas system-associated exonuclease Cas4 (RecB family)
MYEECPRRVKFKYIDRIDEPERPLPAGKTEHPHERGSRVHDDCEKYVKGELEEMPKEAKRHFQKEFEHLRQLYTADKVELEMACGVNDKWEYVDEWNEDTWCLVKMDAEVKTPELGIIIDFKTGKRHFNEIKHGQQMQLYQIAFFKKHPDLPKLRTELWYLDLGEVHAINYTRKQGLIYQSGYDRKAREMLTDTEFKPTPSQWSCKFCPYGIGEHKTGHCLLDASVKKEK